MKLAELETFLAIVETGSLARASARLNVTQSTVTVRLRNLEGALGQTLLERGRGGAALTSVGLRFEHTARIMTGLWRQARYEASLPGTLTQIVNLGFETDLWTGFGDGLCAGLRLDVPDAAVSAWNGSREELIRWASEGMIDAAFSFERGTARLASRRIGADTLRVYADVPGASARHHPGYVYVDLGEAFRESHAHLYADASTARSHFGCAGWALDHLLTSGGSAYLPERIAARHVEEERLFEVEEAPVLSRPIFLVSRSSFENDTVLDIATRLLPSQQPQPDS